MSDNSPYMAILNSPIVKPGRKALHFVPWTHWDEVTTRLDGNASGVVIFNGRAPLVSNCGKRWVGRHLCGAHYAAVDMTKDMADLVCEINLIDGAVILAPLSEEDFHNWIKKRLCTDGSCTAQDVIDSVGRDALLAACLHDLNNQ